METTTCRHPPPNRFRAAVGVGTARFLPGQPPFLKRGRSVGRYAAGIRYELGVGEILELWALGRSEIQLRLGQWIEFQDRSGKRWCQVDALWIDNSSRRCLVCEIKYQHTPDAWWQLKHLYVPVLQRVMPGYILGMLEIVHWFDPGMAWPEPFRRVAGIADCIYDSTANVTILNPKRDIRFQRDGHSDGGGGRETTRG
jgi:hypothetical protein